MAGNITTEQLKEVPKCHHGSSCVLKTGTSKSSSYGKSFFICNNVSDRCAYATQATTFEATTCKEHEQIVELKAFCHKENGARCYFRCVYGKEKGKTWCGYELVKPPPTTTNNISNKTNNVLRDITNHNQGGKVNRLKGSTLISKAIDLDDDKDKESTNKEVGSECVAGNGDKGQSEKDRGGRSTESATVVIDDDVELASPEKAREEPERTEDIAVSNRLPSQPDAVARVRQASAIPDRLSSALDLSQSSFTVPRDKRVSDISETSSVNSSNLSNESTNDSNTNVYNVPSDAVADVADVAESSMLSNTSVDLYENEGRQEVEDSDLEESDLEDIDISKNSELPARTVYDIPSKASTVVPESDVSDSDSDSEIPRGESATAGSVNKGKQTTSTPMVNRNAKSSDNVKSTVFDIPQSAVAEQSGDKGDSPDVVADMLSKSCNIIEISDSSDDESSEVNHQAEKQQTSGGGLGSQATGHSSNNDTRDSNAVAPRNAPFSQQTMQHLHPSMLSARIANLNMQLKKQMDLYTLLGANMPDKGRKLVENINSLKSEIEAVKEQYLESRKYYASLPHGAMPLTAHYPRENPEYHGLPVGAPRADPLFGGRMTESRLKEVNRITSASIEQLHKSLESRPKASDEAEDPEGLSVSLMSHQKQALAWLMWREKQNPPGGILADDMGLGKTLTMISLAIKSQQDDERQLRELPKANTKLIFSHSTLIICPASLIHQWHKEIDKRAKGASLSVCIYHGQHREKRVRKLANYDIVLTTYSIAGIEGKKYSLEEKAKPQNHLSDWNDATQEKVPEEGPIFKIFWRRIVLDEGHTIKNYKTGSSIAITALEGESRWIVTGTPIQNNTMELYSLIKFLRVTPFDELKVWKREVDNKCSSGNKRMNSIVASLLLRRTKDQTDVKTGKPLVSLPKQSKVLHKLKLTKEEAEVYELVQGYSKQVFTKFLDSRKDGGGDSTDPAAHKNKEVYEMPEKVLGIKTDKVLSMLGLRGGDSSATQGCLLVLVLRLRQCCTHLSLMCEEIDPELCRSEGIDIPIEDRLGNMSIQEEVGGEERPREMLPIYSSSKITKLMSCLDDIKQQSAAASNSSSSNKPAKSVIVSQWSRMLNIVAQHLRKRGYRFEYITGSVDVKKRSDIVDAFNNNKYPEVILLSLKAGGVGLNLIGGSNLFLLDQHWNPALEEQASDRIYRVGQQSDVVVHRFLCSETVEERIAALQEKKRALANSVLYGGKAAQKLTLHDLKMIFGLGN